MYWCASFAFAQSLSPIETRDSPTGKVVEFVEGEYAVFKGIEPTEPDWEIRSNPYIDFENKSQQSPGAYQSMIGRFYFDRAALENDLIAIHVIGMRGNFSVSMNGTELFRNFADIKDQKNPWYRPFLIPVPESALRIETNEVIIHSFSRKSVGIGRVFVGSNSVLQTTYKSKYFWHIAAPRSANFTTLVLGFLVFAFWIARKKEIELIWLSISAVLFFIRNHQYYVEDIPFNYNYYSDITVCANYFSLVSLAAFYFYFIKLKNRKLIISLISFAGLPVIAHFLFFSNTSLFLYLFTAGVMSLIAIVALVDIVNTRSIERGILGFGVVLLPFASLHDIIMLILYRGDGHATYLAVFCSAIYTGAFIISFAKRALGALSELGKSQLVLEQSISDTRAELMESEAIRQELLVTQAMTSERARIMQEMHDGIGSNLTTALAVARQQSRSIDTVTVLKRALGDLKLTVDSLEPVEGDIVALIGNLRHRMARDLEDAGITCKWEVGDCAPLEWLDATNALHVLRIHNEAISNILSHSNAKEIRIGCIESNRNGIDGILTYIADDGDGFEMGLQAKGKGLANIEARARALHGQLSYNSQPGSGTTVQLWLPYIR